MSSRLLSSSSALLWGLQSAFLSPILALLLVALFDATPADVGWVLAVYNASGFVAALVIPGWADRTGNYLRPMLISAILTVALGVVLALVTALPVAVVALAIFGGPGAVGATLLFAELRRAGAGISEVMNTRALISFAWVGGPPMATFIMGGARRPRHPPRPRRRRHPQHHHHHRDDPLSPHQPAACHRSCARPVRTGTAAHRRHLDDHCGLRVAAGHQRDRGGGHGTVCHRFARPAGDLGRHHPRGGCPG
ncbi:hypothetical protein [Microbacterium sp.]|uniref:hypothetical protein n=1 Tax=Microbacterium sp. TaxID=51671 RepID=UPI003C791DA5